MRTEALSGRGLNRERTGFGFTAAGFPRPAASPLEGIDVVPFTLSFSDPHAPAVGRPADRARMWRRWHRRGPPLPEREHEHAGSRARSRRLQSRHRWFADSAGWTE